MKKFVERKKELVETKEEFVETKKGGRRKKWFVERQTGFFEGKLHQRTFSPGFPSV